MKTVLAIEDSQEMRELLEVILSKHYRFFGEGEGESGLRAAAEHKPDIILLDLGLPEMSGYELIDRIRSQSGLENVPIVILSAKKGAEAHTLAYKLGADNYLEKPFQRDELLAIIENKLRNATTSSLVRDLGNLVIDLKRSEVKLDGKELDLTPKEFKILTFLVDNMGKIVPREKILKSVWGETHVSDRVIDNHITALRKKLEPGNFQIESIYSQGYCFKKMQ